MYSIGERTMPDSVVHREKELCVEHIFCMHSMECVNNMWLQVESYIDCVLIGIPLHRTAKSRKMCILWSITYFACVECVPCGFLVASRFTFN